MKLANMSSGPEDGEQPINAIYSRNPDGDRPPNFVL